MYYKLYRLSASVLVAGDTPFEVAVGAVLAEYKLGNVGGR
jgi:hypothetical protein